MSAESGFVATPSYDLVLSSGFLAFARHIGFLDAVEDARTRGDLSVGGICGTSSGAMTGALWAAGWPARRIADELGRRSPLRWLRPSLTPWRGVLSMGAVIEHLSQLLPPRIEDLPIPFGLGVIDESGAPVVITEGLLPETVAASCAMPIVFAPVSLGGRPFQDGGAKDRLGLTGWRSIRGPRPTLVHKVMRSAGPESGPLPDDIILVESARSGATFFSLGDLYGQADETRTETERVLDPLRSPASAPEPRHQPRPSGTEQHKVEPHAEQL